MTGRRVHRKKDSAVVAQNLQQQQQLLLQMRCHLPPRGRGQLAHLPVLQVLPLLLLLLWRRRQFHAGVLFLHAKLSILEARQLPAHSPPTPAHGETAFPPRRVFCCPTTLSSFNRRLLKRLLLPKKKKRRALPPLRQLHALKRARQSLAAQFVVQTLLICILQGVLLHVIHTPILSLSQALL